MAMAFSHHLLPLLVLLLAPAWVSSRPTPAQRKTVAYQKCLEFRVEVTKMQESVERDCSQHRDCSPPNNTSSACCLTIISNATATVSQQVACGYDYFITGLEQLTFSTMKTKQEQLTISKMKMKLKSLNNYLNYRGINTCKVQVSLHDFSSKMKTLYQMLESGGTCK